MCRDVHSKFPYLSTCLKSQFPKLFKTYIDKYKNINSGQSRNSWIFSYIFGYEPNFNGQAISPAQLDSFLTWKS